MARGLLEREGPDGLLMRRVAAELGIRTPSLYKHLPHRRALENELIAQGLWEQGERMRQASEGSDDPLFAAAGAYRSFAHDHPHLYRLIAGRPLDRVEPVISAEAYAVAQVRAVVAGDQVVGRRVWAFVHGMIDLELSDRFPPGPDVEVIWASGLDALRPAE